MHSLILLADTDSPLHIIAALIFEGLFYTGVIFTYLIAFVLGPFVLLPWGVGQPILGCLLLLFRKNPSVGIRVLNAWVGAWLGALIYLVPTLLLSFALGFAFHWWVPAEPNPGIGFSFVLCPPAVLVGLGHGFVLGWRGAARWFSGRAPGLPASFLEPPPLPGPPPPAPPSPLAERSRAIRRIRLRIILSWALIYCTVWLMTRIHPLVTMVLASALIWRIRQHMSPPLPTLSPRQCWILLASLTGMAWVYGSLSATAAAVLLGLSVALLLARIGFLDYHLYPHPEVLLPDARIHS